MALWILNPRKLKAQGRRGGGEGPKRREPKYIIWPIAVRILRKPEGLKSK